MGKRQVPVGPLIDLEHIARLIERALAAGGEGFGEIRPARLRSCTRVSDSVHDFNGDGLLDFVVTTTSLTFQAVATGSISC